MNLRKKTILAISATFIGVLGICAVLANFFFLESFRNLEQEEMIRDVEDFHHQLDNELNRLSTLTNDWAVWDDSYAFIDSANQAYIESNLVESTFTDLNLSYMAFINNDGHIVYGKAYDPIQKEFLTLGNKTKNFFLSLLPQASESIVKGYYSDNSRLLLFSANPILTSKETGPSRGILVFARYFDGEISDNLSSSQETTAEITPVAFFDHTDYKGVKNNPNILYDDVDRNTIKFATFISDINGIQIFAVESSFPRTIYKRGLASMREVFLSIGIAGVFASAVSIVLLEKGFLNRLSRLTAGIKTFNGKNAKDDQKIL